MNIYKIVLVSTLLSAFVVNAQSTAGKTLIAKGKVKANTQDASRNLKRRSIVFDNDIITTGKNSKAQLRMLDGGMIALKENSELQITDYRFSDENSRGSVVMELVKGGLRSVTGAIKAENGDYNLKTPTGSIGVRGTHYEVELIDGDMFIAVWDGAIDVVVAAEGSESIVSFGKDEDYSFGIVSKEGQVTQLLSAPENFNDGHSTDDSKDEGSDEDEESSENNQVASEESSTDTDEKEADNSESSLVAVTENDNSSVEEPEDVADDIASSDQTEVVANTIDENLQEIEDDPSFLSDDDFNAISTQSTEELLAQRTGSFNYNNVESFQVNSNAGAVSNFNMNMTIDFDNSVISTGQLSFDDSGGQWFAAFNGIITADQLNLDISFASHGNNLADGDINASFFDGLDSIIGEFDLREVRDPNNRVDGSFLLK